MSAVDALMAMVGGSNSQSELLLLGLGFYLPFDDIYLDILIYDWDSWSVAVSEEALEMPSLLMLMSWWMRHIYQHYWGIDGKEGKNSYVLVMVDAVKMGGVLRWWAFHNPAIHCSKNHCIVEFCCAWLPFHVCMGLKPCPSGRWTLWFDKNLYFPSLFSYIKFMLCVRWFPMWKLLSFSNNVVYCWLYHI